LARHNYIIQRYLQGHNDGSLNAQGNNGEWRDCGTDRADHRDSFGNEGFNTKTKARKALASLRKGYPTQPYRLIQITE
jgi:hypothetical protein